MTANDQPMKFASALTTERNVDAAIAGLLHALNWDASQSLDLLLVFLSPHFAHDANYVAQALKDKLHPGLMVGSTAQGVIGKHEIEDLPAMSVLAGHMPNVELTPLVLQPMDWAEFLNEPLLFDAEVPLLRMPEAFLLIADPFSVPIGDLLEVFNARYPNVPVVGGMASGAAYAGGNVLFCNDLNLSYGVVGVAMAGALSVDVIVSQGCRPIGQPMHVSDADQNLLVGLDGEVPLAVVQNLFADLSDADRMLMRTGGLYLGRSVRNEPEVGRGDFLVRGVMGMEAEKGSLVVVDVINAGEVVQFHLRDATTAEEDFELMLAPQAFQPDAAAALLFTCNGRGSRLYNRPDGDVTILHESLGDDLPVAGFFCAGELGPIGGRNFMHSYTASLIIIRPA